MKRTLARILFVAMLITVGWLIGRHTPADVSANAVAAPLPLAWGSCKAAALFQMPGTGSTAKSCLVFEDVGGVIRLVDTKTGKVALIFTRN